MILTIRLITDKFTLGKVDIVYVIWIVFPTYKQTPKHLNTFNLGLLVASRACRNTNTHNNKLQVTYTLHNVMTNYIKFHIDPCNAIRDHNW